MANPHPFLRRWMQGNVDFSEMLYEAPRPLEEEAIPYEPQTAQELQLRLQTRHRAAYRAAVAVLCTVFAIVMLLVVGNLPPYGSPDAPTVNEVGQRYVEQGMEETGAVNSVAGMILDYRAFDTLGESFVLFTAMCTVTLLMAAAPGKKQRKVDPEVIHYGNDPIVRTVCKLVIPIILLFGIYVVLNGHLSPGGGFSGGAIMASALIIYAIVWGEEQAAKMLPKKVLSIVVLCALAFYALSKTYSFFTGANHLHSVISPGTPGRILSAGLILPVNVAVGLVVCCTMYSFYRYVRRGELYDERTVSEFPAQLRRMRIGHPLLHRLLYAPLRQQPAEKSAGS